MLQSAEWLGRRLVRQRRVDAEADAGVRAILAAEAGGIGDLLNFYPALYALRRAFPAARITLLAAPVAGQLAELWPERCFDELVRYEWNGAHRSATAKLRLVRELRRRDYDLVYSPDRGSGMREESLLAFLTGARHRLGFTTDRAGALCTASVRLRATEPIMTQNLAILRAAAIPVTEPPATLQVDADAGRRAEALLRQVAAGATQVVVAHVGADWEAAYRTWPAQRFGAVAGSIVRQRDHAAVVVVGTARESPVAAKVCAAADHPRVVNLCGQTDLATLVAVVQRAHLVLGNDSSLLHIAAAAGTPMVAIFGSTNAAQVLPPAAQATVVNSAVACRPCYFHQEQFAPPCGRPPVPPCLDRITEDQVCRAVLRQLASTSSQARSATHR